MDNLLNISLRIDGKEFIECDYIQLIPCSRTSMRTLIFKKIRIINNNLELLSGEYEFCVSFKNKNLDWDEAQWYNLDMITSDFFKSEIKNGDDIYIKSILTHDKHFFYEQDIIDIYNLWQNNKNVNWNEVDLDFKYSYISACYFWAKLPQKFTKNKIIIDCELIKEQVDLFYYLGQEMFEERSYCGSSFHQFKDCISMLCKKKPEILPTIIFKNFKNIKSENIKEDIDYLVDFLEMKKFIITI
ncbi:hypothetical protein QFZ37_002029 [Chryseobacterium ginsenosidimutans]|uniref:hypothetical protein n=1 Tax=Chryseobacterium ginsenosidimutans TaxID=687846 RepID=UPI0027874A7F|nr:hypothetical protein [Chryseobacterium ginsenosidimutans]MDQ0593660.1 hypothetical protein [Chryseobacterium ginsenosidimutans]